MPRRDRHRPARADARTWIAAATGLLAAGGLLAYLIHSTLQGERKAAEHGSVHRAIEQAREDLDATVARTRNSATKSQPVPPIPLNPSPGNDKGAIVRNFIDGTLNQLIASNNDYDAELRRIGWEKILDPDRIGKDRDLKESLAIIDAAKAAIAKCRARNKATVAGFHDRIAKLPVDDAERNEIAQHFDNDPDAAGRIDAHWDMEGKVVDEFDDLLGLLRRRHGQWRIVNHKFMFTDPAALSEFQTYASSLEGVARRAEAMRWSNGGSSE